MSNREKAIQLLEEVPEYKIDYVIAYIQGVIAGTQDIPNDETLAAFAEVDEMKKSGAAQKYNNLDDLWNSLEV